MQNNIQSRGLAISVLLWQTRVVFVSGRGFQFYYEKQWFFWFFWSRISILLWKTIVFLVVLVFWTTFWRQWRTTPKSSPENQKNQKKHCFSQQNWNPWPEKPKKPLFFTAKLKSLARNNKKTNVCHSNMDIVNPCDWILCSILLVFI